VGCHFATAADRNMLTVQWLGCLQGSRPMSLDYSRSAPPANRWTRETMLIRIRESFMMELRQTKFE